MNELKNFQDQSQKHRFYQILIKFGKDVLFFGFSAFLVLWYFGILDKGQSDIKCNAETVVKKNRQDFFYDNGNYFNSGVAQSQDFALEGKSSLKLDPTHPFGFGFEYEYLKGNEELTVSVWKFAEGEWVKGGKIVSSISGKFWQATEEVVERNDSGWEKIQYSFSVPNFSKNEILNIYCWNPGSQPVYFDNLHIMVQEKQEL